MSERRSIGGIAAEYRRRARSGRPAHGQPDRHLLSSAGPQRTRGVAAQHASLSRWRSPVRIRSGPPSASSHAPSSRPDGAFPCPRRASRDRGSSIWQTHRVSQQRRRRRPQARRLDGGGRGPSVGPVAIAVGVVAVLAVAVILLAGPGSSPASSPGPTGSAAAATSVAGGTSSPGAPSSGDGSASPSGGPSPSSSPTAPAQVAIVPVVDFRSTETSVKPADVTAALTGKGQYAALELVAADADAILAALGAQRPTGATLVTAKDAPTLAKDLAKHRDRLGFLRADQVRPVGPRPRLGRPRACSGSTGSPAPPTGSSTPSWRPPRAAAAFDPARDMDHRRGRRHHARPGRGQGRQGPGQGRRLPVQRRDGDDHRSDLLLGARQPGPGDPPDRGRRSRAPPPRLGRPGRGQLREPGPERVPLPHRGDGLLGRPEADRRARPGRDRHRLARQQPHPGRRGAGHPRYGQEPQEVRDRHDRGRGEPGRGAQAGRGDDQRDEGRDPRLRHDRQVLRGGAVEGGHRAAQPVGRPGRHQEGPGRRGRRRDRLPALGHRVHPEAVRGPAAPGPRGHRRRSRHGHRQPRPLGRRDGGLQGQADLVRPRQLRVRPGLVGADDGGDHPRADLLRVGARPGPDAART